MIFTCSARVHMDYYTNGPAARNGEVRSAKESEHTVISCSSLYELHSQKMLNIKLGCCEYLFWSGPEPLIHKYMREFCTFEMAHFKNSALEYTEESSLLGCGKCLAVFFDRQYCV